MGRRTRARGLALSLISLAALLPAVQGCRGRHETPGEIEGRRLPAAVVAGRDARRREVSPALRRDEVATQILFGDLHVHTTFSIDAFALSLPVLQGEGAHPPADACDFARYCSALDFWSINDHAESLTPQHWRETVDSIRRCNAVAGDPADPDVVAFLGWEWSQVGATAEEHYGHKNVILRGLDDADVPTRPIAAPPQTLVDAFDFQRSWWEGIQVPLRDPLGARRYFDFSRFRAELLEVPRCAGGVGVRELPDDCQEVAATPAELFSKLAEWDVDSLVIPHGTSWGFYTPPRSSLAKQLARGQHDPQRQLLFEVYSGHGGSEEYRDWSPYERAADGVTTCPAPGPGYLPCCWQAGEIVRSRCGDIDADRCEKRVQDARRDYLAAGMVGHLTVPGATAQDWKDCGQCRDCFAPAFNFRPLGSAQYALAVSDFGRGGAAREPRRFRFGFIGSSDVHSARPGTGYKELERVAMTEAGGPRSRDWAERLAGVPATMSDVSVPLDREAAADVPPARRWESERQSSFFLTGGLAAVHSRGRGRDAIWSALRHRHVYGTSGDRILLWFDLLETHRGDLPMGSEVVLKRNPRFRVRAAGAFEQEPGCPEHARAGLTADRLARLCRGECYNPSGRRRRISRIEVVRVRPQAHAGEAVADLVEDPWRTLSCAADAEVCTVEFADEEFVDAGRESVYYVRAIQEPTMAVNAAGLRCTFDASGRCEESRPCYGDWRTPRDDDCLAPIEERAWSSPIFVTPARSITSR